MATFCNPKHDFISPLRSVGLVVSNGKISKEMINFGLTNPTPYYPHADGAFRGQLSGVKRGEIVLQTHDLRIASCSSSSSTDPFFIERENCTMKGITILNGQGDLSFENYEVQNAMQVMGVVEMDNGCRERYNIISDGIMDVRNNGNKTITVGDTVLVYFPTREEVRRGGGKNQNKEEAAGVAKAWYIPYQPGLHSLTVKAIYGCLQDTQNTKGYLPAYRRMCHQFYDSVAGMAMVMMARILPDLRDSLAGPDAVRLDSDSELLSFVLAKIGHSKFQKMDGVDARTRCDVINALSIPFSTNSRNATEYLFPQLGNGASKRERGLMNLLNDVQQESTNLFLEAVSHFQQQINDRIVGRAKSTARPGMDFSLKIDK